MNFEFLDSLHTKLHQTWTIESQIKSKIFDTSRKTNAAEGISKILLRSET